MQLVTVKDNEVFCDSSMIAKKFNFKHNHVIKVCDSLLDDIADIKGNPGFPLIIKEEREYRGAVFIAYLMDRNFFSLLCMRFKGKNALEWQIKFNNAFYAMEKALQSTSPILDELNQITKIANDAKCEASSAGSTLAKYKKVGPANKKLMDDAFNKVQLTLGFE